MSQSATRLLPFTPPAPLPLAVDCDSGRLTSDGGWTWIEEAEGVLDLGASLTSAIPGRRRRHGRPPLRDLLRQRIYQIAAGYEAKPSRRPPTGRRCGCSSSRPPGPRGDPASAPSSPRRKRCPRGRTPASSSLAGPTHPPRTTSGTPTGARPRTGARTSRSPASPTGSPATACSPTRPVSSCTPLRTACSTPCDAGWWPPGRRACRWSACGCGS